MRSWAYNGFGVLMGTSWRASGPRWPSLRIDSLPMITLFPSQGDFCATAMTPLSRWGFSVSATFDKSSRSTPLEHLPGHLFRVAVRVAYRARIFDIACDMQAVRVDGRH